MLCGLRRDRDVRTNSMKEFLSSRCVIRFHVSTMSWKESWKTELCLWNHKNQRGHIDSINGGDKAWCCAARTKETAADKSSHEASEIILAQVFLRGTETTIFEIKQYHYPYFIQKVATLIPLIKEYIILEEKVLWISIHHHVNEA